MPCKQHMKSVRIVRYRCTTDYQTAYGEFSVCMVLMEIL